MSKKTRNTDRRRRNATAPLARLIWCLWFFSLVLGAQTAAADENQERMSAVLYPATQSWRLLSAAPKVSPELLGVIQEKLKTSFLSSIPETEEETGRWGCSFIRSVLAPGNSRRSNFCHFDFNEDGKPDVVYVGSAACAEGDATVVWLKTAEGYFVRQRSVWHVQVLRVSPKGEKVASVQPGCCGDPVDIYLMGPYQDFPPGSRLRATTKTAQPREVLTPAPAFRSSSIMKLRETPQENEEYDEIRSGLMNRAVFGNILRKYLPGVSGVVVATEIADGKPWAFVLVSEDNDPLLLENPYQINVGWTNDIQITDGTSRVKGENERPPAPGSAGVSKPN